MACTVAFLDVWAPAVHQAVRQAAPPGFQLRFAESYDAAHQQALAADAQVVVPGFAAIDAALLHAAPGLRLVHKWGIGIDQIDLAALRARGISLAITAGANAAPVAELAVALMLAVYRRIPYVNRVMRQGQWPNPEMRETCYQISGKTVGLVGFGQIGRMTARRLAGFDARIVYADPQRADADTEARLQATPMPLAELLTTSDIISLHLPLMASTRHLVNASTLAAMKPGAVLINTARGGLVDEAALCSALQTGHLRGAGLDAFDPEPPTASNPLLALDNVVLTPHAGGGVFDNVGPVARHVFGNIERFLRGQPWPAADTVIA